MHQPTFAHCNSSSAYESYQPIACAPNGCQIADTNWNTLQIKKEEDDEPVFALDLRIGKADESIIIFDDKSLLHDFKSRRPEETHPPPPPPPPAPPAPPAPPVPQPHRPQQLPNPAIHHSEWRPHLSQEPLPHQTHGSPLLALKGHGLMGFGNQGSGLTGSNCFSTKAASSSFCRPPTHLTETHESTRAAAAAAAAATNFSNCSSSSTGGDSSSALFLSAIHSARNNTINSQSKDKMNRDLFKSHLETLMMRNYVSSLPSGSNLKFGGRPHFNHQPERRSPPPLAPLFPQDHLPTRSALLRHILYNPFLNNRCKDDNDLMDDCFNDIERRIFKTEKASKVFNELKPCALPDSKFNASPNSMSTSMLASCPSVKSEADERSSFVGKMNMKAPTSADLRLGCSDIKMHRRGRPRKNTPKVSLPPLYVFIRNMLHNRYYNPSVVSWVNDRNGIFRVNSTVDFARTWGRMKSNRSEAMNYEKLSRAMRYHYGNRSRGRKGHLAMVKEKRLVYKFGELAVNWKPEEVVQKPCHFHELCKNNLCLWTKE